MAASLAVSVLTFWGLGGLVHWHFYVRRRHEARQWKLQPDRWLTPAQLRLAFLLAAVNLTIGSFLGGTLSWHIARGGWSTIYLHVNDRPLWWLPVSAVLCFVWIDAGLYYSHRLLHDKRLFRHIHRHHHRFVAPVIFTTTAMHPVEFLIFTAVLFAPAFVIPMHAGVYIAVILYTYFIGMVDHAGIRLPFRLPLHSDARFHDEHHTHFHCNYGHHTALFDRLHGTHRRADREYGEHVFH